MDATPCRFKATLNDGNMLRRLRGSRVDSTATSPTKATGESTTNAGTLMKAAVVVATLATPAKPLTIDEKIAMLPDKLVEIVPGISMPFSRQELVRIKKRFVSLQRDDALTDVSVVACASMPELIGSPFAKLLLRLVGSMRDNKQVEGLVSPPLMNRIGFDGFLTTLSVLSGKQTITIKRQVLFYIYDVDCDNRISVDDFITTLLAITSALSRTELQAAVGSQFSTWVSQPEDSALSAEAFQALFSDADVHAAMTVAF